jgi:hypothetical protein
MLRTAMLATGRLGDCGFRVNALRATAGAAKTPIAAGADAKDHPKKAG